jgi:hypothetical protein
MFRPVPDVETVQIPVIAGNKIRPDVENRDRPQGGIKPVKSAIKALYAFTPAMKAPLHGPAVSSWAEDDSHDRAEQADPS